MHGLTGGRWRSGTEIGRDGRGSGSPAPRRRSTDDQPAAYLTGRCCVRSSLPSGSCSCSLAHRSGCGVRNAIEAPLVRKAFEVGEAVIFQPDT